MKNKLIALTLVGIVCLGATSYASSKVYSPKYLEKNMIQTTSIANTVEKSYRIITNGVVLNLPEDTKNAFETTGKDIMVPLRGVAEALRYEVKWDGETGSVELNFGPHWTKITIGKDYYFYGKMAPISLGKSPEIINERTFVPLDFVEKILKARVSVENDTIKITNTFEENPITLSYSFDKDKNGFEFGFVDLPVDADTKDLYELNFDYKEIPVKGKESKGLYLTGHNRSDDLFMYTFKKIGKEEGFKPNTKYNMNLSFSLATNIPGGMIGVGGAPGESVYVKAGIVNKKPVFVIDENNYYRLNLDKGNQLKGGKDLTCLGNMVKSDESIDDSYAYKHFETSALVETDTEGNAWIIIGSDSGFEGKTEIYLDDINVSYTEVVD